MNKEIYRLAIPNIITNITIPLLGMVDLAMLGHLSNPVYLGAVSVGSMIFNILYWGMNFIRMSTTGFTSQAYGKNNAKEIAINLFRPVFIGVIIGLMLILLKDITSYVSFKLLSADAETEKFAALYFNIRIWAAPASLALYGFYGWFIGMQNSKYPLIIAVSINVINIVFSYFFIYKLGLNSNGAAYGTLLAQYSGIIIAIILIARKYKNYLHYKFVKLSLKANGIVKLFRVNIDIFIRTLGIMLVFTFFTGSSANKSTLILDTNTILFQFYIFFTYFIDGFAYATESLSGKFFGQRNKAKLLLLLKNIFTLSFTVSIVFTIIYIFAGKYIVLLMTENKEIINTANKYLIWSGLLPLLSFSAFIWDGVYVGLTASKHMRNTMLASSLLIFFPTYYIFENSLGNNALWLALIMFLFSRGAFQTFIFFKKIINRF